jgi:3-oxoacyl-[acyl-carrier-protein] synthase-3
MHGRHHKLGGPRLATYAQIIGWGKYLPPKVLTNDDLAKIVDTNDEWIRSRSGIRQRHIAGEKESTSTMATKAAEAALEIAGISPSKLDMIILATDTPDYQYPASASLVQDAIGARNAGAVDICAGCPGLLYGLTMANGYIKSGMMKTVMVIGSETMSRALNWKDRSTCVLFGDGAGCLILQATDQESGILYTTVGSDGSGGNLLMQPGGGSKIPASMETVAKNMHTVHMQGPEVYKFAVNIMGKTALQVVKGAGLELKDVDLLVPHQANIRIIDSAAKALKLPPEKVFVNVDRYANTSAATIGIALTEAVEQGKLKAGDNVVLVSFGAGLSWAGMVLKWGVVTPRKPSLLRKVLNSIQHMGRRMRSHARRYSRKVSSLPEAVRHEE